MNSVNDFQTAIDNELNAQSVTNPELSNITTSSFAEWIGIRDVFANVAYTLVALWAAFKAEVLGMVNQSKYGTGPWWKETMLSYQDGDPLPVGKTIYAVIDDSKKIITRVSLKKDSSGSLIIKVATNTGALDNDQFSRVNDYVEEVKPFCADHKLVSLPADLMRCEVVVRYDGKLIQGSIKALVEAAINDYMATKIVFDGRFNINRFRDVIEAVPGVIDVDVTLVQIKPNAGTFVTVLREYEPVSGYYNWITPTAPANPSVITYLAA